VEAPSRRERLDHAFALGDVCEHSQLKLAIVSNNEGLAYQVNLMIKMVIMMILIIIIIKINNEDDNEHIYNYDHDDDNSDDDNKDDNDDDDDRCDVDNSRDSPSSAMNASLILY